MLVKPVLQVLNRLMLKDMFDNVLAGKAFNPVVFVPHFGLRFTLGVLNLV